MTNRAYQTQQIFFAFNTTAILTAFDGNSYRALQRAKARVMEIDRKNTLTLKRANTTVTIGYAAQEVKRILREEGVSDAIIQLGGAVISMGRSRRIGVQNPFTEENEHFAYIDVEDKAVVTKQLRDENGAPTARRHLRLTDEALASVTLIGDNAVQLSALCNNAIDLSIKDAMALLNNTNVEAIFVTENQQVFTTDGLTKQQSAAQKAA